MPALKLCTICGTAFYPDPRRHRHTTCPTHTPTQDRQANADRAARAQRNGTSTRHWQRLARTRTATRRPPLPNVRSNRHDRPPQPHTCAATTAPPVSTTAPRSAACATARSTPHAPLKVGGGCSNVSKRGNDRAVARLLRGNLGRRVLRRRYCGRAWWGREGCEVECCSGGRRGFGGGVSVCGGSCGCGAG